MFFFFFGKGDIHSIKEVKDHDTKHQLLVGESPPCSKHPHLENF